MCQHRARCFAWVSSQSVLRTHWGRYLMLSQETEAWVQSLVQSL